MSISARVSNPHDRSAIGRLFRWTKGESTIDQRANDLGEDIRTKPALKELQTWAKGILERFQKGQLQTNNTAYFWRVDKSIALASNEIPKFIKDAWAFTNKSSGWVLPEISLVFSNEKPACVVIDFSSYGVAVGPPEFQLPFDADKTNQVLPGIYTYEFFE